MQPPSISIDLRGQSEGEQNNRLNIAVALHVAKWTKSRSSNPLCGSSIPEGEATLWEYLFTPPQFNGDPGYWRKLPDFATSMDAVMPLSSGLHATMVQFPELGAWLVTLDGTPCVKVTDSVLPRAICIALLRLNGVGVTIY